eukprot:CAMPEP_0115333654 /NCGR_PEP_ID=MMETSP0270-20121206/87488_1 /TAXON_ID=71861 /ORGANISM="Scrippsiella trochoidea, Strain CCMP3099" /LENGTH=91 /DNA_ID=CAMNT_0002754575 /DNA_START=220 /DNA_END=491 /DNA_ORIENTATION=-
MKSTSKTITALPAGGKHQKPWSQTSAAGWPSLPSTTVDNSSAWATARAASSTTIAVAAASRRGGAGAGCSGSSGSCIEATGTTGGGGQCSG